MPATRQYLPSGTSYIRDALLQRVKELDPTFDVEPQSIDGTWTSHGALASWPVLVRAVEDLREQLVADERSAFCIAPDWTCREFNEDPGDYISLESKFWRTDQGWDCLCSGLLKWDGGTIHILVTKKVLKPTSSSSVECSPKVVNLDLKKDVLSIKEAVACYEGISRSRLYEWKKTGDVQFIKVGRRSLIVAESLHRHVMRFIV